MIGRNYLVIRFVFFIIFIILTPLRSIAQEYGSFYGNNPRLFSIDVKYLMFNDIQSDPTTPRKDIGSQLATSLNLRFFRTFSLCGLYNVSVEKSVDTISAYGLGLRMDLPGIFFINGTANDLVRKRKRRSINSYFQWSKLQIREANAKSYVADRMAFGLDGFVAGNFYLNFEVALYSHQGNQFLSPGIGIGYEF